jgi:hypothetical protein
MRTIRFWALIGVLGVTGVTAVQAVAAATKQQKVVSVGAVISRNGNSFQAAYKLTGTYDSKTMITHGTATGTISG